MYITAQMDVNRWCLCVEFGDGKQEGVMKYWLHLLGTHETKLFADTMGQQRNDRGNTVMNRIKQKLVRLGPEGYLGERKEQQQSGQEYVKAVL